MNSETEGYRSPEEEAAAEEFERKKSADSSEDSISEETELTPQEFADKYWGPSHEPKEEGKICIDYGTALKRQREDVIKVAREMGIKIKIGPQVPRVNWFELVVEATPEESVAFFERLRENDENRER